jgi:hypothetical protein
MRLPKLPHRQRLRRFGVRQRQLAQIRQAQYRRCQQHNRQQAIGHRQAAQPTRYGLPVYCLWRWENLQFFLRIR